MRGTGNRLGAERRKLRFIPAHAGNGRPGRLRGIRNTVHPRACGERRRSDAPARADLGSSPRMRGTDLHRVGLGAFVRFIPAHAGNGANEDSTTAALTVHPRACGERYPGARPPAHPCGSSPRMRGTVGLGTGNKDQMRFIPAHAGNGVPVPVPDRRRTVHPRACGERAATSQRATRSTGSSPRMRGTGLPRMHTASHRRFIPAHAGNGRHLGLPIPQQAVHPRACGERGSWAYEWANGRGSSPRMRGTGTMTSHSVIVRRFIPAHAGNGRTHP
ncbi:hypothetical protein METUNv1_02565 [Methyloversatilis universalis FAM5]|uniref:Uncharacterized protein n=1 Tax=Methyloversatilis universalis (strain ATCC BAA-1314 / DSM 25237 / JCM 13912 / CCUG 52030 / FAM5) TaxID=1000565 RepID=F5RE47_METUF|nr:hypothetical protein METUNv1_02565 [Methyloversatilis universalis FAM5]